MKGRGREKEVFAAVAIELWKTKIQFGYFCTNYKLNTKWNEQMREHFSPKFASQKTHPRPLSLYRTFNFKRSSSLPGKIIVICYYASKFSFLVSLMCLRTKNESAVWEEMSEREQSRLLKWCFNAVYSEFVVQWTF